MVHSLHAIHFTVRIPRLIVHPLLREKKIGGGTIKGGDNRGGEIFLWKIP